MVVSFEKAQVHFMFVLKKLLSYWQITTDHELVFFSLVVFTSKTTMC